MIDLFVPNPESRKKLADKIGVDYNDNMQDWEYEISESCDFNSLVTIYSDSQTTSKEHESLMEIMLDKLNDCLTRTDDLETYDIYSGIIFKFLKTIQVIHSGTIYYWRNYNSPISKHINKII